jgi:hypothetical protein
MIAISPAANAVRPSFQDNAAPQLRRAAEQAQATANALQMQARDAWQRVENATSAARAIDGKANQAVSSADKAKRALNSFGAAVLSAKPAEGASAPSGTYAVNANVVATAPITAPIAAPAQLNTSGQVIGARVSVEA